MSIEKYYETHYPWNSSPELDLQWMSLHPSSEGSGYSSTEDCYSPRQGRYATSEDHFSYGDSCCSSSEGQYSGSDGQNSESERRSSESERYLSNNVEAHQKSPNEYHYSTTKDSFNSLPPRTQQRSPTNGRNIERRQQADKDRRVWYSSTPAGHAHIHHNRDTLYKTELCHIYDETGACHFGSGCKFAHGHAERRTVVRHHQYRTKLCQSYHEEGLCSYGPRCFFIH